MKKIMEILSLCLLIFVLSCSSATASTKNSKKKVGKDNANSQDKSGIKLEKGYFEKLLDFTNIDIEQYTKKAEQGDVETQRRLGYIYKSGDYGVPQDLRLAIKWFRQAAEQGDAEAQCQLGYIYKSGGDGVPQDLRLAIKWFRQAAEQGDYSAQILLGNMYYYGNNVHKDLQESIRWYCKSFKHDYFGRLIIADDGIHDRYADYPRINRERFDFNKTLKLAKQGNVVEQIRLGYYYVDTEDSPNFKEAAKWFRKAAEQGDHYAQVLLGYLNYIVEDYPHDFKEAAKWFRKAALQSDCVAQFALGVMYFEGLGIPQNFIYAHAWSSIAASQGNRDAKSCRDIIANQFINAEQLNLAQILATELEHKIDYSAEDAKSHSSETSTTIAPRLNGSGTGFTVTKNGYILTCHHVIATAKTIKVCIDKEIYSAIVVEDDKYNDLALLKISGNFQALAFSPNQSAKMGQEVFTIGYPNPGMQGLNAKFTKGYISSISGFQDDLRLYQISTPVQPGNSGGPLLDNNGNVIGIIVAMLDAKSVFQVSGSLPQNVNYAVKNTYAKALLNMLPNIADILPVPSKIKNFDKMITKIRKSIVMVLAYE